tara:strand:- start:690 stop:842 length:153 start_codon:yes stop_codon:yes gene_type:complete
LESKSDHLFGLKVERFLDRKWTPQKQQKDEMTENAKSETGQEMGQKRGHI